MTISGKTNLITEILAAAVWLIAVASAGPDRLIVGVLAATAVLAGGAALINMTDGGGIDEIGSALVLVFAAWMSAFSVMILTMLPQVQMVIMWVLERRSENV